MSVAPTGEPARRRGAADPSACVARLYERHGRMAYGLCRAMLRDAHEAEDATQQAYLSAYRALLGGAQVRDEGAWIATIARNECRGRIAAAMRTPLPVAGEDLDAVAAPGDEVERHEQADAVRYALAGLPERQRQAVVLRDLYGLRQREVATALGLSRPATEALLFRARRSMRLKLRPLVAATLSVPLAIQEGLAQAIPGFAGGASGAAAAGAGSAAGVGVLAKLTAGSVGAKVATATVAVATVGAVGTLESERPVPDRVERPAAAVVVRPSGGSAPSGVAVAIHRGGDGASSGPGSVGQSGGEGPAERGHGDAGREDGDDRSGPGSSERGADSTSTSGGDETASDGRPHRGGDDSGGSGSSRSGEDDHGGGVPPATSGPSAPSGSGGPADDLAGGSSDRGPGSSGSGVESVESEPGSGSGAGGESSGSGTGRSESGSGGTGESGSGGGGSGEDGSGGGGPDED